MEDEYAHHVNLMSLKSFLHTPPTSAKSRSYVGLAAEQAERQQRQSIASPQSTTSPGSNGTRKDTNSTPISTHKISLLNSLREVQSRARRHLDADAAASPFLQKSSSAPPSTSKTSETISRLKAENKALLEELAHSQEVAQQVLAARKAVGEALSEVSAQNTRLVTAWMDEKQQNESLREQLHTQKQAYEAHISALQSKLLHFEQEHQQFVPRTTINTPPSSSCKSASPTSANITATASPVVDQQESDCTTPVQTFSQEMHDDTDLDWDSERVELLSLLDKLQTHLEAHAEQQQTPLAAAVAGGLDPTITHKQQQGDGMQTPSSSTPLSPHAADTEVTPPRSSSRQQHRSPLRSHFKVPYSAAVPSPPGAWFGEQQQHSTTTFVKQQEASGLCTTTPPATAAAAAAVNLEASFSSAYSSETEQQSPYSSPAPPAAARPTRPNSGRVRLSPPCATPSTASNNKPAAGVSTSSPGHKRMQAPVIDNEKQVKRLVKAAETMYRQLQFTQAAEQYTTALQLAVGLASSSLIAKMYCGRGIALLAAHKYLEAAADCCRAIRALPACSKALDIRAECFNSMGAWDFAVQDLSRLLESGASPADRCSLRARLQDAHKRAQATDVAADCYAVLGIKPQALLPDIKAAYKSLALKFHPDKAADALGSAEAGVLFGLVSSAHAVLSDSDTRREHDLKLLRRKYGQRHTSSSTSSDVWSSIFTDWGC